MSLSRPFYPVMLRFSRPIFAGIFLFGYLALRLMSDMREIAQLCHANGVSGLSWPRASDVRNRVVGCHFYVSLSNACLSLSFNIFAFSMIRACHGHKETYYAYIRKFCS